jgi:hypothetical protein
MFDALLGRPVATVVALDAEAADLQARLPALKLQLMESVASLLTESPDLTAAQPLAREIKEIEARLLAIPAERVAAQTAEETRQADIRRRELAKQDKARAAHLGEIGRAARELDQALSEVHRWRGKADAAIASLFGLTDDPFPPGSGEFADEAITAAVDAILAGQVTLPSVTEAFTTLREHVRSKNQE